MAIGPLFPAANNFSWVWIDFIQETDYTKPNPTKLPANTLRLFQVMFWRVNTRVNMRVNMRSSDLSAIYFVSSFFFPTEGDDSALKFYGAGNGEGKEERARKAVVKMAPRAPRNLKLVGTACDEVRPIVYACVVQRLFVACWFWSARLVQSHSCVYTSWFQREVKPFGFETLHHSFRELGNKN